MTERTYVQFYALQDDKQTRIMAVVGADEQVCLFSYPRAVAAKAPVTAVELNYEGFPADGLTQVIGVQLLFSDVQQR